MKKTSILKRFAAYMIEVCILLTITFIPNCFLFIGLLGDIPVFGIIGLISLIFVMTVYSGIQLILCDSSTTIGKKIVGLKVVHQNSDIPVTLSQMLLRELILKRLSSLFMIGYIMAFFNDGITLHDKISKTVVIEEPLTRYEANK